MSKILEGQERPCDAAGSADALALLALLDDPHEWGTFGRPAQRGADAASVTEAGHDDPASVPLWDSFIVLHGMHCAACALNIEQALRDVPGVESAEVSAATQRARVTWRPRQVRPSQWLDAVRRLGYAAVPAHDALAREQRQSESRRALWRCLVSGFCMMQVMMYAWPAYVAQPGDLSLEMETLLRWASWVISLPVVLFCCGPFFSSALRDVRARRISMDLPVALGMGITFAISSLGTFDPQGPFGDEVFFDSLTMFVFFLLSGRWLELRLRDKTAGALEAVLNRLPDAVLRQRADGSFETVSARRLRVHDVVRVRASEAFPADGTIVRGHCHADEALLTGESAPVLRCAGECVTAGSYNLDAVVDVRVDALGSRTRFAQIVALMESATLQKPRLAQLADRIARPFLLVVLLSALGAALWWWNAGAGRALMVAVSVLIVTCPCALSLATPVAMLTAAGTLARQGVLVRKLQALETLAGVDTVVFDKTGTLTRDALELSATVPTPGHDPHDVLALAALVAGQSIHPAARAIVQAGAQHGSEVWTLDSVEEHAGLGLQAQLRNDLGQRRRLRLGSQRYLGAADGARAGGEEAAPISTEASTLRVLLGEETAQGWRTLAQFHLREVMRPEAAAVVQALKNQGIALHLLSGDRAAAVQAVAARLDIAGAQGDCSPADKLQRMQQMQAQGRTVAMVGDGLNDGPVLAGAHVAFAFGRSLPLAQSRADFVMPGGDLRQVLHTCTLARRTLAVVRQNLAWAAGYNTLCIPLALWGLMPAWLAGLGMAASSLLVLLNAARLAHPPAHQASE